MSSVTFVGLAAADSFTSSSVRTKLQNKVLQHAYPADHASNRASYIALHRPNFTPVRQKDRHNMDPVGRSLRRKLRQTLTLAGSDRNKTPKVLPA